MTERDSLFARATAELFCHGYRLCSILRTVQEVRFAALCDLKVEMPGDLNGACLLTAYLNEFFHPFDWITAGVRWHIICERFLGQVSGSTALYDL